MNEWADSLEGLVTRDAGIDAEFEERLRESSTLAFRVAYGVLRHKQDAEDVAQDAFVRAHRSFHQLRDREKFRAWLVRMTWRLAIDRWRANRRWAPSEEAGDRPQPATAEQDAVAADRAAQLWTAIDTLPPKLRLAIVLSAIEEHDIRKVARLLDLPEGTVKSRLFLARKALAEKLQCLKI